MLDWANMSLWLLLAAFAVGLVLIVKGGDWFVDAASWIARVSGIPSFIIGATIVSVATTLPEMIVSLMAAARGSNEMAVGNAVGSVTANTAMILALSLIFMKVLTPRKLFLKKVLLLTAAVTVTLIGCLGGQLPIWASVLLLIIFALFIWENLDSARKSVGEEEEKVSTAPKEIAKNIVLFVLGAAGIVIGSRLLIDTGTEMAVRFGVPERVIAVTFVAVGTSLPELVTTITAIIKHQTNLSVGNIVGANLIDMTLILPLCSLVSGKPLPISHTSAVLDIPACLAVTVLAFLPAMVSQKFRKWQGFALLAAYAAYMTVTFMV